MSTHTPLRTPRKAAKGLGAAKEGVHHWVVQRVTALALAILVPWFFIAFIAAYKSGYENAQAWLATPITAILMLLLVSAAFYHMRLGMQVVIEDYVAKHGSRLALLLLNTFVTAALWVTAVFSILKVAL